MKKTIVIVSISAVLTFVISFVVVYKYMKTQTQQQEIQKAMLKEVSNKEERIASNAEIVYQYYYTKDQVTKEQTEPVQDYMKGLSLQQVQSIYEGWQVVYFASDKVILRCSVIGSSKESYLLGEKDGYLAVFLEDENKKVSLYECTNTPVQILPETEQRQLKEGITILGEANLTKVLAEYTS